MSNGDWKQIKLCKAYKAKRKWTKGEQHYIWQKKWNLHLLRFHKKLLGKSICQIIDNIFGKKYRISDNILKKMKIDNNEVFVECFCNAKISEI